MQLSRVVVRMKPTILKMMTMMLVAVVKRKTKITLRARWERHAVALAQLHQLLLAALASENDECS